LHFDFYQLNSFSPLEHSGLLLQSRAYGMTVNSMIKSSTAFFILGLLAIANTAVSQPVTILNHGLTEPATTNFTGINPTFWEVV
jgi:hypothetical protein